MSTTESSGPSAKRDSAQMWMLVLLGLGVGARLCFWWPNPPFNSFDDHYEVVSLILDTGGIPSKLACYQCYHPPLFYLLCAGLAKVLYAAGVSSAFALKALQGLNCAFGIGTLIILYVIAKTAPGPALARALGFCLVALLPRHLYMGAMFANDAAACFFAALTAWLALRLVRGADSLASCLLLGLAAAAAIFTKYNGIAVLPMIALAGALAMRGRAREWRRTAAISLSLLLPLALLSLAVAANLREYGSAFRSNAPLYDAKALQPHDSPRAMSFTSFEPWQFVAHPFLAPGQLGSTWTLLEAGLFFDTEPRFATQLGDQVGWAKYFAWMRGRQPYPGDFSPQAFSLLGSALELTGLFWLLLGAAAVVPVARTLLARRSLDGSLRELVPLAALLAATVAGVAWHVKDIPAFTSAKASFLLVALPSFAAFASVGAESLCRHRAWRAVAIGCACVYAALSMTHALYYAWLS